MITFIPGRLHDFTPPPIRGLMTYATAPLPAPALTVTPPALSYPVACNDVLGDCTIADVVHSTQVWSVMTHEPWKYCGDPTVKAEYLKHTGGQDTGLVISQLLATWQSQGLGQLARPIDAYAPVHYVNLTEVKQTVEWFGTCRLGVNLPQSAMNQTNANQPWDLTGTVADTQILGGHDVPIIGYDATYFYVVTWGRIQPVTYRWFQAATYVEEAWAIVPSNFEACGGDGRGLNVKLLVSDIGQLNSPTALTATSFPTPNGAAPGTVHQG